jgi:hypothetical protein
MDLGQLGGNWGRILLILGLLIAGVGAFLAYGPKIPWLGHLPGDIVIKREHFSFYFPITTCIILSLVLSLIFKLFRR